MAIVDIGGGTTDLAIYEKGSLWHTAVLQVGGEHFTNDVAVALRTPVNEAEKIKKKHGCALTSMVPEEDSIEATLDIASVRVERPPSNKTVGRRDALAAVGRRDALALTQAGHGIA